MFLIGVIFASISVSEEIDMKCEFSVAWEISLYDNNRELVLTDFNDGTLFISIKDNQLLLSTETFPLIFQKQVEWKTAGFLMSQSFSYLAELGVTDLTVNNPKCDKILISSGTPRSIVMTSAAYQTGTLSVFDCPCE